MLTSMTKTDYNKILHDHVCIVVFTKKDGSERRMRCTLKMDMIPGGHTSHVVRSVPEHQVRVVDVDKGEWRSFTIDSVKSFEIEQ